MPQGGGWRSEAAYDYVCELGPSEFAWEFLRRNPDYRRDYRAVVDEGVGQVEVRRTAPLMERWGLRFPFRSSATGT